MIQERKWSIATRNLLGGVSFMTPCHQEMSIMTDLSGLQGRSALITGGASGIGAAIARRLAELGAAVQIADLDLAGAQAVAAETRGEAWHLDLSDPAVLGGIELEVDILVNNAGVQRVSPIEELDPEVFHSMLMIMVEAPFRLIRSALPYMYAHRYGRIVNVSSVHGLRASAVQICLRHRQARPRGSVQGDCAGGRSARRDEQLRQPRLRPDAAGREAGRRPGPNSPACRVRSAGNDHADPQRRQTSG